MATIPAYAPIHLPFLGLIPGGFRQGYMVRIRGALNPGDQRISINFQCGPALNPQDDIALHISIRLNEFAIVRNHYENLRWGVEERSGGCPIRRGQQYEILILSEPSGYKIAIDGRHFCDFKHRIALNRVQFVNVSGETEVSLIGYETDSGTPVPFHTQPIPSQTPGYDHHHHHHHHRHHSPNRPPIQLPIAPIAPSAPPPPVTGIVAAPYPGPPTTIGSSSLYPQLPQFKPEPTPTPLPMPMPMPINPTPPPPYNPPYVHQTIETNTYPPPPYSSSPYPTQQPPIKVEQAFTNQSYPGSVTSQTYYPANTCYTAEKKKSGNTALKVAAVAGGIGLGAYALSKVLHHSSSSDSD